MGLTYAHEFLKSMHNHGTKEADDADTKFKKYMLVLEPWVPPTP